MIPSGEYYDFSVRTVVKPPFNVAVVNLTTKKPGLLSFLEIAQTMSDVGNTGMKFLFVRDILDYTYILEVRGKLFTQKNVGLIENIQNNFLSFFII